MRIDLNCDLGEGEPRSRTQLLMRAVTSANIACGGHAGTSASMRFCLRQAKRCGVRPGAHPGAEKSSGFGRDAVVLTPDELELLLLKQVGALQALARQEGIVLRHVKLHGALYHATDSDVSLARRYAATIGGTFPGLTIFARAGGQAAHLARRAGLEVWEEAFLDRGYCDDGTLVPRSAPGALIMRTREVLARLRVLMGNREIVTATGRRLPLRARTVCLHSDTPNAARLVQAVARELRTVTF